MTGFDKNIPEIESMWKRLDHMENTIKAWLSDIQAFRADLTALASQMMAAPVPERVEETAVGVHENVEAGAETAQTLGEQFEQTAKPNLQQSLGGVRSSDFLKSLSLNDRFRLTRELFTGDSGAFAEAVTVISNASDSREAIHYLRQTIHWDENNAAVMEFRELIEQFFLQK